MSTRRDVSLTPAQVSILIDAAAYYETVLEDEIARPDTGIRIATLNRAIAALARAARP